MKKRFNAALVLAIGLIIVGGTFASAAPSARAVAKRITRANEYLLDIMEAPDISIPEPLLRACSGVMFVSQLKFGFIIGARGGEGLVMVRDEKTKKWSPPAFIRTAAGTYGFQIGGQSTDAIILIMNKDGVQMLAKTKFKIGVDASASAGPVGREASASVGPGTAMLVYSRAKGLYAGATFEAGMLIPDYSANEIFYGVKGISVQDILFKNAVPMPQEANSLIMNLEKYASPLKKETAAETTVPNKE